MTSECLPRPTFESSRYKHYFGHFKTLDILSWFSPSASPLMSDLSECEFSDEVEHS